MALLQQVIVEAGPLAEILEKNHRSWLIVWSCINQAWGSFGTHQGPALGPLLYSIDVSDLPLYASDADIVGALAQMQMTPRF